MLRVRAPWLRLPCISTAGTPLALSWRASALAPCLVRVKTMVRPGALVRSTSTCTRCARSTCSTWWSIAETGDCAESAWWVTGWFRKRLTRVSMAASRVAENSSRWPVRGVCSRIRRTAGRKPRSAMWSASSSTVTSMSPSEQWRCLIRSSSRPGQASTMSAPRRRLLTCGTWLTPPKIVIVVRPAAVASGLRACSIWPTSSRVGARISARGEPGRVVRRDCARRATTGRRKA